MGLGFWAATFLQRAVDHQVRETFRLRYDGQSPDSELNDVAIMYKESEL